MKSTPILALALGLATFSACGAGTGSVTTSLRGERTESAAAPAYFAAAKPDEAAATEAAITGAVSAVTLAVEKIVAHRAGEGNANAGEGTESDGENGWEVLVASAQDVDLLNTATANLGTSELSTGKYTQIRLYLKDNGNTITVNGINHPLTVPSGALKLVGNANVEADIEYMLAINFDLDHSLVTRSNGYTLKPTVKYSLNAH